MKLSQIISNYVAENDMSYRDFGNKCGISNGYISMIVHENNPKTGKPPVPTLDAYTKIAHGLGMTLEALYSMLDDPPEPPKVYPSAQVQKQLEFIPYIPSQTMVPIIGKVRCGAGGLAYEELQGVAMADVANPKEYFYLRAEGDSMEPKISDGDLVLIHRQEEVENGELAVVIINGEEGTLKRFIQKDGAVILQSINPNYPPRVIFGEELKNVCIAGKAVELKRQL